MRICVYGSSSKLTPKPFMDAARKLGERIAQKGLVCVNGGGKTGVMGAVNEGARSAGGKTLGVIHRWVPHHLLYHPLIQSRRQYVDQ